MTTIAYHHGDKQIAVDSRATAGAEILTDKGNKTIKNNTGIWFFTGAVCDEEAFAKLKHNDHVDKIPDCCALLIKDGEAYYVMVDTDKYCCHQKLTYNCTFGSGREYAIAAMDHGKSAPEAVKYAMTRDCKTGGRVRTYNVI